jgi:hypothetical protein
VAADTLLAREPLVFESWQRVRGRAGRQVAPRGAAAGDRGSSRTSVGRCSEYDRPGAGGQRIVERRAKHRHEALAQELVDEALLAVYRLDHEGETAVEKRDNLLRRALAPLRRKVADVKEHHADLAGLARELTRSLERALDHPRRKVLTEQVGHALVRRRLQNWVPTR